MKTMSDEFTATHTGEIRSTENNLPLGQRTTVGLRSTAQAWVDRDGVKYSKETGKPIGEQAPQWELRLSSVNRMPSIYKTTAAQPKPATAPEPAPEPPVAAKGKRVNKPAPDVEPPVAERKPKPAPAVIEPEPPAEDDAVDQDNT
jgi:hypothetical protein